MCSKAACPRRGRPVPEREARRLDYYAVMGNPVGHSLSPRIHGLFAAETGEPIRYRAELVPLTGFAAAVAAFIGSGGKGLNVTLPFKQEAFRLSSHASERARVAGAVNTLWWSADGAYHGDNTDGVGLIRDLTGNHGIPIAGLRVLVLGAGGAVRGVLGPILEQHPASVVVANRTVAKAMALGQDFQGVYACGLEDLGGREFDLIVNGTSAGLTGGLPPLPDGILCSGGCCYDLVYAMKPTPFVSWAKARGARLAVDGLGMLVEQAAESFFIWRGLRPSTRPVIEALRPGGSDAGRA
jgi:shikimate dehydrogenase